MDCVSRCIEDPSMKPRVTLAFVILAAAVLLPAPVRAQALGAIAGSVTDVTGAALPGVTVDATSPALIEGTRSVVTDGQGRYSMVSLVPGTYAVTFRLTG